LLEVDACELSQTVAIDNVLVQVTVAIAARV
jgi:hypothetical protein